MSGKKWWEQVEPKSKSLKIILNTFLCKILWDPLNFSELQCQQPFSLRQTMGSSWKTVGSVGMWEVKKPKFLRNTWNTFLFENLSGLMEIFFNPKFGDLFHKLFFEIQHANKLGVGHDEYKEISMKSRKYGVGPLLTLRSLCRTQDQ